MKTRRTLNRGAENLCRLAVFLPVLNIIVKGVLMLITGEWFRVPASRIIALIYPGFDVDNLPRFVGGPYLNSIRDFMLRDAEAWVVMSCCCILLAMLLFFISLLIGRRGPDVKLHQIRHGH